MFIVAESGSAITTIVIEVFPDPVRLAELAAQEEARKREVAAWVATLKAVPQ